MFEGFLDDIITEETYNDKNDDIIRIFDTNFEILKFMQIDFENVKKLKCTCHTYFEYKSCPVRYDHECICKISRKKCRAFFHECVCEKICYECRADNHVCVCKITKICRSYNHIDEYRCICYKTKIYTKKIVDGYIELPFKITCSDDTSNINKYIKCPAENHICQCHRKNLYLCKKSKFYANEYNCNYLCGKYIMKCQAYEHICICERFKYHKNHCVSKSHKCICDNEIYKKYINNCRSTECKYKKIEINTS